MNKSKKQNIKILLSTVKKSKENKLISEIKTNENNKTIDISLNSIIIPKDNINITDGHKSFINKFNSFLSNNSIYLEYNVPAAKDEKEILKKD